MTLALAAVASAGGFSVVQHGTRAAVDVIKRTTHTSSPRTLFSSPGNNQYKKHCSTPPSMTPKCHITIFDSSIREGSSGTTTMLFTVSLDVTNDAPVTVNWATRNGTAMAGACNAGGDYISNGGTVTFPAGSPSQTITVLVCGDTTPELNETFFVDLSAPSPNADIFRMTATGTIVNDD